MAVANGKAGAALLEATGERTEGARRDDGDPGHDRSAADDDHRAARDHGRGAGDDGRGAGHDRAGSGHDGRARAAADDERRAAARRRGAPVGGDDSGSGLPVDGLVVLGGVLLMGIAVAFRAIKARERRIGWALLGFCAVYLVALAGVVAGYAGSVT